MEIEPFRAARDAPARVRDQHGEALMRDEIPGARPAEMDVAKEARERSAFSDIRVAPGASGAGGTWSLPWDGRWCMDDPAGSIDLVRVDIRLSSLERRRAAGSNTSQTAPARTGDTFIL